MAKPPRTKAFINKQQSRVEREHKQRRIILVSTITVAVLVILVIGYGILDNTVFKFNRPVAVVDGEKISVEQFQTRARYDRFQLIQNVYMLQQYKQVFSYDPNSAAYFDQQIQSSVTSLQDSTTLGTQVIEELVNDAVIAQEAARLGITVSEEEVDKAIQEAFGYFANGTPTPAPTDLPYVTATYSATQLALYPPTETPTPLPSPTEDTSVASTGTPEAETPEPTVDPAATEAPTATPMPTATPYTLEGFQASFDEYAKNLDSEADFSKEELRAVFRSRLLYEKVLAEITKDVTADEEWVWARHILVATPEEAAIVLERLKSGAKFEDLAAEFSTDETNKDRGGDLSWFRSGMMVTEFETAAFALTDIGQISEPVKTSFGYHVIQLLGKETRPMTSDRLDQVKQEKFAEWLNTVKEGKDIQTFDTWQTLVPNIPALPAEIQ